ncbi:unnamed protein product [Didymodactylos carnosus]|uniref:C-type lectin domain-containing protein n=1 Tax=Didymodactylos carnosus TaxID=1234261 RepID=A0A8S2SPE6_9BILA|nr:unnamed protein product [Didymodactylos carnosus]CAF4232996.1 unnamed protein product [Didymodactylos carnosus]
MGCEKSEEHVACLNPDHPWSPHTLKFIVKHDRKCFIRITEVLKYNQAHDLCQKHGLQLAVIDDLVLLQKLKSLHFFKCKGECPDAKGHYIGLKRREDKLKEWIWANNVTWIEDPTIVRKDIYLHACAEYANQTNLDFEQYADSNVLCYIHNGQLKTTLWNKGEPNDYRDADYRTGEQCVEIISRGNIDDLGKLNDIPCIKPTLGVICEINDLKPRNLTKFEDYAILTGTNYSQNEYLLSDLLLNQLGKLTANLDSMNEMTAALESLLTLPSFSTDQATSVLNVVDQMVDITGEVKVDDSLKFVTNKLLRFLDKFPTKIEIFNNHQPTNFELDNMNISVFDTALTDATTTEWTTILTDSNTIVSLNINGVKHLMLGENNISSYRIIQTIFSNFNLFPIKNCTNNSNEDCNQTSIFIGQPLSYQIGNLNGTNSFDYDLIKIKIRVPQAVLSQNISCVYWDFSLNNGSWIPNGCRFDGYDNDYALCYSCGSSEIDDSSAQELCVKNIDFMNALATLRTLPEDF